MRYIACLCLYCLIVWPIWEWTDRNIEYVCSRVTGREIEVNPFWTLVAAHTGPVMVVFNVGTEIYACTEESR